MVFQVKTLISGFFEKNLFERIIIYLFLADFITKLVFELVLGQNSLGQSQNRQWIFYTLLAVDYLFSVQKIIDLKVKINALSVFSLLFFLMIVQGLFIGILSTNNKFEILNDTIPLLMIGLNILRMQSYSENRNIDFHNLLSTITIIAFLSCCTGFIADLMGRPSFAVIPVSPVYFPLIATGIFAARPFPKLATAAFVVMVVLSLSEINRTTMAFTGICLVGYWIFKMVKNPSHGLLFMVASAVLLCATWMILPEDSKTYRRIIGLTEIDFSARTGSIGERSAEFDSINLTLQKKGPTQEWFGLGFGGLYEYQSTHTYVRNYGHAHYAWAWFKLRFGYVGYIYLFIFTAMLLFNLGSGLKSKSSNGIFIALLCLQGILYLMTYVNAIFLCSGIHFLKLSYDETKT